MSLDDIGYIETIDKGNMMASIRSLPQHIKESMDAMADVQIPENYSRCKYVVTLGMGGSGIPGDFLRTIYRPECSVPIFVHKDYSLPGFVGSHTLVIAVSYSGTTEETIHAFSKALERKAKIFGLSSGDRLLALLGENNIPHFAPPPGGATREMFGYLLFPMIAVLERGGYISDQRTSIAATVSLLENASSTYVPEIPSSQNEAKTIATKLYQKIPILCGSRDLTDVVALRWKQQINENSKVFAQTETFPDLTHNQLAALSNPLGLDREICAVFLRTQDEGQELAKRIDATKEVVAAKGIDLVEHWSEGSTLMARLLSQSYLGDFVSFYLAVLNGIDPTPTAAMSELKRMLGLTDLSP